VERRKPASWVMLDAVDCGATSAQIAPIAPTSAQIVDCGATSARSAVRRRASSARRRRWWRGVGAERRSPTSGLSSTLLTAERHWCGAPQAGELGHA